MSAANPPAEPLTLAERWRRQRLSLGGFSRRARIALLAGLAAATVSGLLLLAEAIPLPLPGSRVAIDLGANHWTLEPRLVLVVASLTTACGVFLLTCAIAPRNQYVRGLLTAAIGYPGAAYTARVAVDDSWPLGVRLAAAIAIGGGACAVVLASLRWARRAPPWIAGGLVAAPWLLSAVLVEWRRGMPDDGFFAGYFTFTVDSLLFGAIGTFVWQVLEGVRATVSGLGTSGARAVRRYRPAFVGFVALNALWLAAGLFGVLPGALGGDASEWASMQDAGWLWPWAFVIAGALLVIDHRELIGHSDRHVPLAVIVLGCGWIGAGVLGEIFVLATGAFTSPSSEARSWLVRQAMTTIDHTAQWRALVLLAALVAGLALARDARRRPLAALLLLVGLWNLPVAWSLLDTGVLPDETAGSLLVLDAALVVLVAALGVLRMARGQEQDRGQTLLLVVFAVIGAAGPASSIAQSISGDAVFYIGLVIAPLWTFLFAARALKLEHGGSPHRLYALVGITAVTLALALVDVSLTTLSPKAGSTTEADLRLILVAPCAAIIALAAAATIRSPER